MMKVFCYICEIELTSQGAIYYSLPTDETHKLLSIVNKYHICMGCSLMVEDIFQSVKRFRERMNMKK